MDPLKIETRPTYPNISAANLMSAFPRLSANEARRYAAASEMFTVLKQVLEFMDHGTALHPGALLVDDIRSAMAMAEGQV